jgi:glucokinase-like ROK family protein
VKSSKINIELMKDYNKKSVLKIIQNRGPISRAEIANMIDLSRPSVSGIVSQLMDEGWIRELTTEKNERGRKPRPLEIDPNSKFAIGVEIGAFKVRVIVCNLHAIIVESESFSMNQESSAMDVLDKICRIVNEKKRLYQGENKQVIGIGIGMHGAVDPIKGVALFAPNLGWKNMDLKDYIEKNTELLTIIENDCNSSALGELWFGHGLGEDKFITVLVDYGIGSSIINDGKIYRGVHHIAGQIGHITVDEDGPKCTCGNYGCLEVMASEPAIIKQLKKRIRLGERSILTQNTDDMSKIEIKDIYTAAKNGDKLSQDVIERAGRYLGLGFANLINLFDPKFLIIGGGIVEVADIVVPIIKDIIRIKVMGDEAKEIPILVSSFGQNLYSIGAATLVIEKEINSFPVEI